MNGRSDAAVDLTNCDREPIHVPGSIQPHGVLIATDAETGTIVSVSANAGALLGVEAEALIGNDLAAILDGSDVSRIREDGNEPGLEGGALQARLHAFPVEAGAPGHRRPWTALVHRHDGLTTLELDPSNAPRTGPGTLLLVSAATTRLQASNDTVAASQIVCDEVRRITGFDRVKLYRFALDWSGEVLAEARDDAMPSYRGLHFPASDIPVQARALYASNPVRLISDVHYVPSPLRPDRHFATGDPIDLRFATLRSVSPIHLQYLRNMGVGASMSASILRDGRLWGLIACHHREPLLVDHERRQACALVAQLFAARLDALDRVQRARRDGMVESLRARLLQALSEGRSVDEAMRTADPQWTTLVDAGGFAVTGAERGLRRGSPPPDALQALSDWIATTSTADFVAIDRLSTVFPAAAAYRAEASGVLAVPLSRVAGSYLMWFRPEQLQTVTWAGPPEKATTSSDGGDAVLHPRHSFANWSEEVRGRATPWSDQDIATALQLREVVLDLYVREKDELERTNLKLVTSARELETFIYVASHDIKEPLRQMEMLASLLRTHVRPEAEAEVAGYFDEFRTVADRLRVLTDELANYAKLGRVAVTSSPVVLADVLEEVLAQRRVAIADAQATFEIAALPIVVGERNQLFQVFDNLVGNALKYRRPDRAPRVRIEAEPAAGAGGRTMMRISIADNGIGFQPQYDERIFEAFWRLHSRDRFPGSGIGLAICRRIVERHHGRIEAHGEDGVGATFAFTLPLAPRPDA